MKAKGMDPELAARFDEITSRFDKVDGRFDRMENRLEEVAAEAQLARELASRAVQGVLRLAEVVENLTEEVRANQRTLVELARAQADTRDEVARLAPRLDRMMQLQIEQWTTVVARTDRLENRVAKLESEREP